MPLLLASNANFDLISIVHSFVYKNNSLKRRK